MGLSVKTQHASGSYTGDGAVQNVVLGFKPSFILLYNETDGDTLWLAIEGLADDKAIQVTNHADTQVSLLAADGITLTNQGFSIGTALSESAKVIRYYAV